MPVGPYDTADTNAVEVKIPSQEVRRECLEVRRCKNRIAMAAASAPAPMSPRKHAETALIKARLARDKAQSDLDAAHRAMAAEIARTGQMPWSAPGGDEKASPVARARRVLQDAQNAVRACEEGVQKATSASMQDIQDVQELLGNFMQSTHATLQKLEARLGSTDAKVGRLEAAVTHALESMAAGEVGVRPGVAHG